MAEKLRWTITLYPEERDALKLVWRNTFPDHGLAFSAWALVMIRKGTGQHSDAP